MTIFGLFSLLRLGINVFFFYTVIFFGYKYLKKPKIQENDFTDIKFNDIVGIDEYKEEL